ncbi:MAG: hypothetical protein EOO81_04910, partial [Oxalobacteraceae bacterium]
MKLEITEGVRRDMHRIVLAYRDITQIPKKGRWKQMSVNELWLHHIGQVMVVGGAASKERFDTYPILNKAAEFERLKAMMSDDTLKKVINTLLRRAGVRYAAKDYQNCLKSAALAKNLRYLAT